jgi:HAD superfamily hydrolase (TIGR01509 family)
MLEAVLFDMDGVIIDSEPIHYQLSKLYYAELGLNITDEEYYTFVGIGDKEIFTRLKEKYGLKLKVDEMVETYQQRYIEHLQELKDERPIRGVDILIKDIYNRGFHLALGSSATRRNIEAVLEYFKLREYFDVIVSGCEVEKSKPSPDIYVQAAKKLGVDPSGCIVIEDSSNGVRAAKSAGMKCIAYKNPNSGEQDISLADIIIDSFEGLDFGRLASLLG